MKNEIWVKIFIACWISCGSCQRKMIAFLANDQISLFKVSKSYLPCFQLKTFSLWPRIFQMLDCNWSPFLFWLLIKFVPFTNDLGRWIYQLALRDSYCMQSILEISLFFGVGVNVSSEVNSLQVLNEHKYAWASICNNNWLATLAESIHA